MNLLKKCELCPRRCRVDRFENLGFCNAGAEVEVALFCLHKWEEPCLVGENGAGTVFFAHCNLRCVYCQNHEISQENNGTEFSIEQLSEIFIEQ